MAVPAYRLYPNLRCRGGESTVGDDAVAVEEPLEIRIGKLPVAVIMRTPGHDDELAAGFLLTEGVIQSADDLVELTHCDEAGPAESRGNVIVVTLRDDSGVDLNRLQRNFYATSSCGVCGKASIAQLLRTLAPFENESRVSRGTIAALPDALRDHQAAFAATGGVHAAGLFDVSGRPLCVREDVGRHNAVDKVVGWSVLEGRAPLTGAILQVSGRTSFEIVQKAWAAGISVVACVSAPTTLAVDLARQANMVLAAFVRGENMAIFAGAERLLR